MKLIFKTSYLSINNSFKSVVVPDITIISGINGAGKTHLLKAIDNGSIDVEGISNDAIIYYDSSNYVLNDVTLKNDQGIFPLIKSFRHKYRPQSRLGEVICQPGYDIFGKFGVDLKNLISIQNDKDELQKLFPYIHQHIIDVLNIYNIQTGVDGIMKADLNWIYSEIEREIALAHTALMEMDEDFYHFIRKQTRTKNIFSIRQADVENPNIHLSEIATACGSYSEQLRQYKMNLSEGEIFKLKNFERKFGPNPIDGINNVLNQYDCNGYYLSYTPTSEPPSVTLLNRITGVTTTIDNLSSGERILIGLALGINKLRKPSIMPRIILLDEIDSSLHPSMIKRLLNVIYNEYVNERNMKIIMVTHSPSTIALCEESSLFILQRKGKNIQLIKGVKGKVIDELTEGFMSLDRGLSIVDELAKGEITIFSEGNNINFLKKAIELIHPELKERIYWADKLLDRSGKSELKILLRLLLKIPHQNKVLFVFDCDVNINESEANNSYYLVLPKNEENQKVTRGIENLFPSKLLDDKFFENNQKLNKKKFQEYIIRRSEKKDFKFFTSFITKVQVILR
jgi:ABC-type uncharacterized transport system ATPase component